MKRLWLVLCGVAVCVYAGCGGGSSSSSSTASTPASSTPSVPSVPAPAATSAPASTTSAPTTSPMPMGGGYPTMPPGAGGTSDGTSSGYPTMPPGAGGTTSPNSYPTPGQSDNASSGAGGYNAAPGAGGYQPTPMNVTPTGPDAYKAAGYNAAPGAGGSSAGPSSPDGAAAYNAGGYNAGGAPAPPLKPKTLTELSNEAFNKGRDYEAFQYLYAAALVNKEAAEELPEDFRWIGYLKKPSMSVRWGLGVIYNPPKGYTGHPSPIGYTPVVAAATNNPGDGYSGAQGAPGSGQPKPKARRVFGQRREQQNQGGTQPTEKPHPEAVIAPSDPAELLNFYTGELGDKIIEELTSRIEDGKYGAVMQRALESFEAPIPAPAANDGSSAPSGGYAPTPGGYAPMGGYGPQPDGAAAAAAKAGPFKPGGLIPGVVMLGEGNERELIRTAEDQQVDFLILFDVTVRASSKDTASNTTKIRVMSLEKARQPAPAKDAEAEGAKPREIYSSKSINNRLVESAREKNEDDPMETEVTSMLAAIDAEVSAAPLPEKLNAEIATKRATFLASQELDNPLATLAEIRCYHAKKLLTNQQLSELYGLILGPDKAKKLISGKTEAERRSALSKWKIPEAKAPAPAPGNATGYPMPSSEGYGPPAQYAPPPQSQPAQSQPVQSQPAQSQPAQSQPDQSQP